MASKVPQSEGRALTFRAKASWSVARTDAAQHFGGVGMRMLGAPFSLWLLIFSIAALAFALAVLLFRALVLRGAIWSALFAFPSTWVAYEFARNLISVHGTAASVAYSQLRFLPFLQLASITGPWGMSFVLLMFSAALAIGLHLRKTAPKQAGRVVGVTLGVTVVVLVFGAVRLMLPRSREEVKVGLIASDDAPRVAAEGADRKRTRL